MNIWLGYVNYPITTAVYLHRALLRTGHSIRTVGPRLPEEAIEGWLLQNMRLPLSALDIDTSFTPDMAALIAETPLEERPDLYIWVESVTGYEPQNLKALNCPTACYLIDTHYHLPEAIETASQFDSVFIAQLVDLEAFRAIHPKVYWLPLACDPEIHGRHDNVPKFCDVGFVGSMNQRREAMLAYLASHFSVHKERSFWLDMSRTFSGSRIILNDASFDDLNMRFFEAIASGSMLLSNRTNGSAQDILFRDGEDYACHNDENLIEVVQYYLTNNDLREKIAKQGEQRVLAAHTYRHRVDDMLNVLLHGKQDTFSPEELRMRSDSASPATFGQTQKNSSQVSDRSPLFQIKSIITNRQYNNWPTWQMVYEWEDILAANLGIPLKPISVECLATDPDYGDRDFDLIFIAIPEDLHCFERNRNIIPVVMDLWRNSFDNFRQRAQNFQIVFASNLQSFRELEQSIPNLRYIPFSVADHYVYQDLPAKKDIDVIHYGRRNSLLDKFMNIFLERYPKINYVTTEATSDGSRVLICSNKYGIIAESDSRTTFMNFLARSKVSLVSTVGMDGSRDTGGIDPVSPRFYESLASGCYLLGRTPDNDEFEETGMAKFCHHVNSYEEFESSLLNFLMLADDPRHDRIAFLRQNSTSSLVPKILSGMASERKSELLNNQEALMQTTKPQTDLVKRLDIMKQLKAELSHQIYIDNYRALSDVIGFCSEFWGLDLFDHFTNIIAAQETSSEVLQFQSFELFCRGDLVAAEIVARRAIELDPDSLSAACHYGDLLRRAGKLEEAKATGYDLIRKNQQHAASAQALIDMCEIEERLPLKMDHYQLLKLAHTTLKPLRYIEIGVSSGRSLALSGTGTSVVGVDPETAIPEQQFFHSPVAEPMLFKLTSNDFFKHGLMEKAWENESFNMAFIDGLHLFEQALMDFINLEARSAPDSLIFVHDCLPVNPVCAERERRSMVWTGDVWKIIPCLKAVRPDLEIITLPVKPSGLALIRKLDRNSKVLVSQFDAIVAHFISLTLPEQMDERFKMLNVTNEPPKTVIDNLLALQGRWQKEF